jgi:CDGSH-type Zn-finger protein
MSRTVIHDKQGPAQVGDKWVCQCGLSKDKPYCDGSHKKTLDEENDRLYCYKEDGSRKELDAHNCLTQD